MVLINNVVFFKTVKSFSVYKDNMPRLHSILAIRKMALRVKRFKNGEWWYYEGEKDKEWIVRTRLANGVMNYYEGEKGKEKLVKAKLTNGDICHYEGNRGKETLVLTVKGKKRLALESKEEEEQNVKKLKQENEELKRKLQDAEMKNTKLQRRIEDFQTNYVMCMNDTCELKKTALS